MERASAGTQATCGRFPKLWSGGRRVRGPVRQASRSGKINGSTLSTCTGDVCICTGDGPPGRRLPPSPEVVRVGCRYRHRLQGVPRHALAAAASPLRRSLRGGVNDRRGQVLAGCGNVTPLHGSGRRESVAGTSELGVPCPAQHHDLLQVVSGREAHASQRCGDGISSGASDASWQAFGLLTT